MEDIYNDPAASETHDEDMLRREIERFRNEVKPADLQATVVRTLASEPHWAWRK